MSVGHDMVQNGISFSVSCSRPPSRKPQALYIIAAFPKTLSLLRRQSPPALCSVLLDLGLSVLPPLAGHWAYAISAFMIRRQGNRYN